jgi:hypothetical protein
MNFFALLSLLSCVISISIGIFVYYLKKEDALNRIFALAVGFSARATTQDRDRCESKPVRI